MVHTIYVYENVRENNENKTTCVNYSIQLFSNDTYTQRCTNIFIFFQNCDFFFFFNNMQIVET